MLMYMFHIAFALGLIALVMGLSMCKGCHKMNCEGSNCGSVCTKICGWIIVILAAISLLCTMHAGYQHYMNNKFDVQMMVFDMDMNMDMDNGHAKAKAK